MRFPFLLGAQAASHAAEKSRPRRVGYSNVWSLPSEPLKPLRAAVRPGPRTWQLGYLSPARSSDHRRHDTRCSCGLPLVLRVQDEGSHCRPSFPIVCDTSGHPHFTQSAVEMDLDRLSFCWSLNERSSRFLFDRFNNSGCGDAGVRPPLPCKSAVPRPRTDVIPFSL